MVFWRSGDALELFDLDHRILPFPVVDVLGDDFHADAFDRTRLDAQLAAGAQRADDGMQLLGGADDGVDRAGLDA